MPHMRPLTSARIAGAAILMGIGAPYAAAQAPEPWPFVTFDVMRYDSLIDTDEDVGLPCCAPHVVAVDGHALIHISAVIEVPWSDELDRISVSARDLTLTVPDGEPIAPFGHFQYRGVFKAGTRSVSASRPRDWPESDEQARMESVWTIPADATRATLTFGEYWSTEIELPQEATSPVTAAGTADFAVTGFTELDRIDVETSNYGQPIHGSVASHAGDILLVDFTITPRQPNALDGRHGFTLRTGHMQLVGPNGLPTLPLGQHLNTALTSNTVNSISGDNFVDSTFDYAFHFLTDGSPGTYTLFYLSDPVAEFTVE